MRVLSSILSCWRWLLNSDFRFKFPRRTTAQKSKFERSVGDSDTGARHNSPWRNLRKIHIREWDGQGQVRTRERRTPHLVCKAP